MAHQETLLRDVFGFSKFRPGQKEIVEAVTCGDNVLAIMPTGGGKSLCFQLPAVLRDGLTVVISPLIALMRDQVRGLQASGVAAGALTSANTQQETDAVYEALNAGNLKLLYLAPERLAADSMQSVLRRYHVNMLAVDEAHCVSQWGHDFRPDYMRLGKALEKMGRPQCVALTATATPIVREDIRGVLNLREPFESISGFERPNLSFTITPVEKVAQKYGRLKKVLAENKTGIVYCATRKKVEEVAETIHSWGLKCIAYHGGMSDREREDTQNAFISRKADIAVATNAFGMGIDRSDVRFVVHFEIPGSVEAYYQEAGRAGRDGEASVCELLFNYADTRTQEFFIDGVNPGPGMIRDVYQFFLNEADDSYEVHRTLDEVKDAIGAKNGMAVGAALGALIRGRWVERFDVPGMRAKGTRLLKPDVLTRDLTLDEAALEEKERRDREKLEKMVQLCYANTCRQQWVLEYFGEVDAPVCGSCDVCRGEENSERRAPSDDEDLIVRKFLSGVARMSRRTAAGWEGIFGRGRIVQMLLGSKSQEVLRVRLHELKTYGILKKQGTAYLNALARSLNNGGLIVTQMGEYPLVTLTPRGEQVMMGKTSYSLEWPSNDGGSKTSAEGVDLKDLGFDGQLYDRLKDVRTRLAKASQVPAYVIFSNDTLEHLARLRPKTMDAGLLVKGIGEAKAEKYLEPFLKVIRQVDQGE